MRVIIVQPPAWHDPKPSLGLRAILTTTSMLLSQASMLRQAGSENGIPYPTPSTFRRKILQQEEVTRGLMDVPSSLHSSQGTAPDHDCGTVNTQCSQPLCSFASGETLYILVLSPKLPAVVKHTEKEKNHPITCSATTIHPSTTCIACKVQPHQTLQHASLQIRRITHPKRS